MCNTPPKCILRRSIKPIPTDGHKFKPSDVNPPPTLEEPEANFFNSLLGDSRKSGKIMYILCSSTNLHYLLYKLHVKYLPQNNKCDKKIIKLPKTSLFLIQKQTMITSSLKSHKFKTSQYFFSYLMWFKLFLMRCQKQNTGLSGCTCSLPPISLIEEGRKTFLLN